MTVRPALAVLLVSLAGCGPLAPPPESAQPPAAAREAGSPLGSPFGDPRMSSSDLGVPLLIDRQDLQIGTTVQFRHVPTPTELNNLEQLPGLSRIVLSFDSWPREYSPLQGINQAPQGVDVIAVLPGWPPSRAAVDAWNYLQVPMRIIVVVPGPPASTDQVTWLNQMRGLERVIGQMDVPSRSGFERLQRPLSFRKIVE